VKRRRGTNGKLTPFAAGIVVIAAILVFSYFAFGGRAPWSHDYLIKAMVRNANDLQERSPVRIAGVNVGEVTKVERGPGSTAIITMKIVDAGLPLHQDATMKIRPRLFLEGNFFVDLRPGTPSSPDLKEGGTIPLAQTAGPVQLDQILTSLQAGTRTDLQQFLHGLSQSLDQGGAAHLHRLVPFMEPALLKTAIATQAMHGQNDGDLAGFVDNAEKTVHSVAQRSQQLPALVSGLDTTLTTLAQRRAALGASVTELDQLVAQAPATFDALNNLFPTLRSFSVEVRPALREAPATLRLANPLLDQAAALISPGELPALLNELDPALRSLAVLEPQLGTLLGKLRPATGCLRRNAIPTLKKSVDDGSLTTGRPVYRELLNGLVGLASASQNFTGDGPAVRYHAGFGDQMVTTGKAPGLDGPLVGLTSEPILGSRPRYTGVRPPFRPDVPCDTQQPPNLTAVTGPAPPQRSLHK
jgi:virulence factor Mce-like protein